MSAKDPPTVIERSLREADADADPMDQFSVWFQEAEAAGAQLPEAMSLATCSAQGRPSNRIVLLRGFDERGFVFFTNYQSRKALELRDNPFAALVFHWEALHRQVRVEGRVELCTPEESDAYFRTRPRGSQLGAWASPQSQVLGGREDLERRLSQVMAIHGEDSPVPRPPFWGGFRVVPDMIEFWQGRTNRLHDRLCYRWIQSHEWAIERFAP